MKCIVAAALLAVGFLAVPAGVQARKAGRFTAYPIEPYCTACLKRRPIPGPPRPIRLMAFDGKDVLGFLRSRQVIYLEHEDFKLVSTVPGYRSNANHSAEPHAAPAHRADAARAGHRCGQRGQAVAIRARGAYGATIHMAHPRREPRRDRHGLVAERLQLAPGLHLDIAPGNAVRLAAVRQ